MDALTKSAEAPVQPTPFGQRLHYLQRRLLHPFARLTNGWTRRLWVRAPLADRPIASPATYRRLQLEAEAFTYPEITAFEQANGYAIDPAFLSSLALHTQVVIKSSRLVWTHGRVLYAALRRYLAPHFQGPLTILETGTARGFSALCMAKALADAGAAGRILTLDIVPHDRPIYWNCIDDAEGKKTRAELLAPWRQLCEDFVVFLWGDSDTMLPGICPDRIHFAFLDAAHDYRTVMAEFAHVAPRQKQGDIIVFDDVTPAQFPGICRAVEEICSKHGYDRQDVVSHERRAYVIATKR